MVVAVAVAVAVDVVVVVVTVPLLLLLLLTITTTTTTTLLLRPYNHVSCHCYWSLYFFRWKLVIGWLSRKKEITRVVWHRALMVFARLFCITLWEKVIGEECVGPLLIYNFFRAEERERDRQRDRDRDRQRDRDRDRQVTDCILFCRETILKVCVWYIWFMDAPIGSHSVNWKSKVYAMTHNTISTP